MVAQLVAPRFGRVRVANLFELSLINKAVAENKGQKRVTSSHFADVEESTVAEVAFTLSSYARGEQRVALSKLVGMNPRRVASYVLIHPSLPEFFMSHRSPSHLQSAGLKSIKLCRSRHKQEVMIIFDETPVAPRHELIQALRVHPDTMKPIPGIVGGVGYLTNPKEDKSFYARTPGQAWDDLYSEEWVHFAKHFPHSLLHSWYFFFTNKSNANIHS